MTQTFRDFFRSEVIGATEGIAVLDVTLVSAGTAPRMSLARPAAARPAGRLLPGEGGRFRSVRGDDT